MIDNHTFKEKKAAFFTLGCKLNFSETSTVARSMIDEGFKKVSFNEFADIYVINTCSVTQIAEKKCRSVIQKAIRQNPNAFIVVTGCFAQLKPTEIALIEGVDLVLGSNEKFDLPTHLGSLQKNIETEVISGEIRQTNEFKPSYSIGDRTRCFLKVQDGCDYFCSYCTIPLARGKSRNGTINDTVLLAQKAATEGAKEIILTGVNIGDFGRSSNESFVDLLRALNNVDDIERYRISSIEPNLLTQEIIDFVATSDKFMPHFHIPLQSGSDNVLKLMKRRYNTQLFKSKIESVLKSIPNAFIGIDVITGVNGESEQDFMDTRNFLNQLPISQIHVFTYSERPNTEAITNEDKVTIEERKRRSAILHELSDKKTQQYYTRFFNTKAKALIESVNIDGFMHGFTENYLKIELPFNEILTNQIKEVELHGFNNDRSALKCSII